MNIEWQPQDDDWSTEPQVEETDTEPDYVSDDFFLIEPFGNPFANSRFIDAMYGELFSQVFRPDGCEHHPFPEGFDPATDPTDWPTWLGWLKEEDMIGREAMLDDLCDVLGQVETMGWGRCLGWDAAPAAPGYLLKLLAIGRLLNVPFTEKQWARAYDLYDCARKQRGHGWDVPDDDEEVEAA
jgi:hypothetical protein